MKILCLFVRHGTEQYPEALSMLDQWYERHGLMDQRTLWILDNALEVDRQPESLAHNTVLRSGDNQAWEFSAWARALLEASAQGESYDVVHCVTSAFNTLYTEYLKHFQTGMLSYALGQNSCLGHIDSYPQPVRLGSEFSQSWIRTCFFFLPWTAAVRLSPWACYRDPAIFFGSPETREFRVDAPLSLDYQSQISAWLKGQEMGGHTWHSPVRHGPEENWRFQFKALAILNEHQLAITLRKSGLRLIDFCWLHSLQPIPPYTIPKPIPEQDQLKIRRKILGIPEQ